MSIYNHLNNILNSFERKKDYILRDKGATNHSQKHSNGEKVNDGISYSGETELQTAIRRWG